MHSLINYKIHVTLPFVKSPFGGDGDGCIVHILNVPVPITKLSGISAEIHLKQIIDQIINY